MEKEKNNSGLIPLIVILFLLVLGLSSYIIYDKISNQKSINDTSLYNYNLSKRTTNQAVREGFIEVLVDTDGNAYLYTIGNVSFETNAQLRINVQKIENQFEIYFPKGYEYYGSTELKAYKLDIQNVLTSYYVHMGNGGFSYFVFVNENGKLSYLSYDKLIYNGDIELKNIENIENVVSVIENTYSMIPYAIISDGSELSLYDYIK